MSTDIVSTAGDLHTEIANLNNGVTSVYSSIEGDDFESKTAVAKAVSSSVPLRDHAGKTLNLRDIIVQVADMTDEDTGEVTQAPRVILIDTEGVSYHATSNVILKDVRAIMGILGKPSTWPEGGVPVKMVEGQSGKNRYYTLNVV